MAEQRTNDLAITDYLDDPDRSDVIAYLVQWVTPDATSAQEHLSDHPAGPGTTLVARRSRQIVGLLTLRWRSRNPLLADRDIPLIHQLSVTPAHRRTGVATALMAAAEQLVTERGKTAVGVTVGLFDQYGPAQRLYAQLGYLPDGRGACRGRNPLHRGETVTIEDDLILWLIKDLRRLIPT